MTVIFLSIFFLSLLGSFVLTRWVRDFAMARGWVAIPTQERHLHKSPLPRLGGVAIFLSFSLSAGTAFVLALHNPRFQSFSLKTLLTILVPASLVFLLGVYDDIRGAGPYFKFGIQGVAATMLFFGGLRIVNVPVLFGQHLLPWFVGLPLTVLWVLAITNAFNLIDGLDGLAAGSALFSTLVAFVVALLSGQLLVTVMTIALAGAILGFLKFNFNPATIFLGDSGSLFIGFVLSAMALQGAQKAPTIVAVAIPVVSFGLPILETALSIVRRLIAGRPVFTADREHIHHKLLQHGMTHRQVVILLYGVSAIFALLSLFLLWPTGSSLGLVLAVLGVGIWIGVQHLGYLEFGELARVAQRTLDQRQIFINNLAIRRAAEELKVARDYEQIRRILVAAFASNDFDALDLRVKLLPGELIASDPAQGRRNELSFHWSKPGRPKSLEGLPVWTLALDLASTTNRRRGSLTVHRLYSPRDLQLDINLLTAAFPTALADALDRTLAHTNQVIALPEQDSGMIAAQAG
ncbi:MAG: undecaprenyl/decaprenyl-phosphate alpha-N-acetylglucosaminyl 1-phosphate transferase [Acidobacteriia bacterium]|nr:undecaprenyl/decaprenyl-phosphate alpha-N-acetylglucosaminyl 1-phosphate transferase [Terriglobia bacterium]